MYTHLIIGPEDANYLFNEFSAQATRTHQYPEGISEDSFSEYFARYTQTYLDRIGCHLQVDRTTGNYKLLFREFLPRIPQLLDGLGVTIIGVEIVRFHSLPTKALAGYYKWPAKRGVATATVENVVPHATDSQFKAVYKPIGAQNITIKAANLAEAIHFNTKLGMGHFNRFLVHAFG